MSTRDVTQGHKIESEIRRNIDMVSLTLNGLGHEIESVVGTCKTQQQSTLTIDLVTYVIKNGPL